MKKFLRFPAHQVVLPALLLLPMTSYAASFFDGKTCTDIASTTTNVPAPGSGSFTVEGLDKYRLPAKSCSTVAFTGSAISFDYTATVATRYNNASFPSSCAGVEYTLNGGPSYAATMGTGTFAFNMSNPTAAVTGTMVATSYSQTDNLTVTVNGTGYLINTELLQFKTYVTINADQSIDMKICTPAGGVPATLNGSSYKFPPSIWQCLSQPVTNQANVRVTFEEGC